jgi:peptidoglycan/LPS O-acetylase OafA/YrhL
MTLTAAPPRSTSAPTRRDAAVDVARAWCLTVVVALHALMVGVSVTAGTPVLQNALEHWPGFGAVTWFVQVMPLFFLLGGFSGIQQWERARGRGVRYGEHLAGRLRRLLVPALAALLAAVMVLAALRVAGVGEELVAAAGFRLSQPLWFLAVYVLCTVALPALVAAHRRRPVGTIGALAAAVVAVDAVRSATGVDAVGLANLAFVWLLVQQLGFVLASPRAAAWRPRRAALLAVAAFGTLALLCLTGAYSADLYANLNPPTGALVLLGVGQLALFSLARPWLARVASVRIVGRYVSALNRRAMTVYSWHMLVLVLSAGALLLLGGESLPAPLSEQWWLTRPLWLAWVAVAVALVAMAVGRWEAGPAEGWRIAGRGRALASAVAGAGGVVLILVQGSTLAGWVGGAALVLGALALLREQSVPSAALTLTATVREA